MFSVPHDWKVRRARGQCSSSRDFQILVQKLHHVISNQIFGVGADGQKKKTARSCALCDASTDTLEGTREIKMFLRRKNLQILVETVHTVPEVVCTILLEVRCNKPFFKNNQVLRLKNSSPF